MNPFQKNPFTTTGIAKPVKPVKQFNEKEKLNDIRETMAKLKNQPLIHQEEQTKSEMSVNDKINTLRDMDRLK